MTTDTILFLFVSAPSSQTLSVTARGACRILSEGTHNTITVPPDPQEQSHITNTHHVHVAENQRKPEPHKYRYHSRNVWIRPAIFLLQIILNNKDIKAKLNCVTHGRWRVEIPRLMWCVWDYHRRSRWSNNICSISTLLAKFQIDLTV